jgi:hypothetical protein
MNSKVKKILENVDKLFPNEEVLDSYFNASDTRQSAIEQTIIDFATAYVPPSGDEPLDFLVDISSDSKAAEHLVGLLKRN